MALINKLTAIADAIRSKTETTDLMTLDEMASQISAFELGKSGFPESIEWIKSDTSYFNRIIDVQGMLIARSYQDLKKSYDGKTWTYMSPNLSLSPTYSPFVCGPNGIIISSVPNNGPCYSIDRGETWIQGNLKNISASAWYVQYTNSGKFFATTPSSGEVWYSEDGKEWITISGDILPDVPNITYANGVYISGYYGTTTVKKSNDGITWSEITEISTSKTGCKIVYFKGKWFAIGEDDTNYYSIDNGESWISQEDLPCHNFQVCDNEMMVGISADGIVYYTKDGDTWTCINEEPISLTNPQFKYISGILFITKSESSEYYYSTDFNVFRKATLPDNNNCISYINVINGKTLVALIGAFYANANSVMYYPYYCPIF